MPDQTTAHQLTERTATEKQIPMKYYIQHLLNGKSLNVKEMTGAMEMIMTGSATPVEMAAFLTALSMKGESTEELVAAATVIRHHALRLPASCGSCVDTCGTGGDGGATFNVSTAAAITAAAAGVRILKHGNRSVSSRCGSADVLEALGIDIHQQPQDAARALNRLGMAFLFAPDYHQSMKHAAPVRKELGFRTIFNVLGPLTNPGAPDRQVVGVFSKKLLKPMAEALLALGLHRALVVCGEDGIDELTTTGTSHICELKNGTILGYTLNPEDVGLKRSRAADIAGGNADHNARIILEAFRGERPAAQDLIALNAGAVIYVAGKAASLKDGVEKAQQAIRDGRTLGKLRQLASGTAAKQPAAEKTITC